MENSAEILLAKQAIYSKDRSLYGSELLFRDEAYEHALDAGEDLATSQVLVNFATSISDELEYQDSPLFINVSESFLLSEAFLPIDQNRVVIEILERVQVSDEFVNAVKAWHQKGYRFALDDYDFDQRWSPLLPYVDYLKIDVLEDDYVLIEERLNTIDRSKFSLLAERVESKSDFEKCLQLGFQLFQGYFLARPKELLGNTIRPSSAITSKIINKANEPDCCLGDLADLVSMDPKLTLQMLKLVNSSLFTLPREINDLKEAIGYLGIDLLKQWALMIAFVSDSEAHIETCRIVLIRAKACELFYEQEQQNEDAAATAFLAGLLSGVDLLLELEPSVFLKSLNLSKDIQNAVLLGDGPFGELISKIRDIEYYITQDPSKIIMIDVSLMGYYSQAQRWAGNVIDAIQG